jgi:hypothetical protein
MANLLPVSVKATKENKSLSFDKISQTKLDLFLQQVPEGSRVTITYEIVHDNGSYAQLSKLHKCIRELAEYSGNTLDEMKMYVKEECGLIEGDDHKSFANCSKEELSRAIETCISIGEKIGFPLY